MSKYNNEILILKGEGDQLDSLTIKEIRGMGSENRTIYLNNGLEKVAIEGVSVEKILGKTNYNLKDRSLLIAEDNDGNLKRIPMSQALEPDRIYIVYRINDTPIFDLSKNYGYLTLIDTSQDSSRAWITNVKALGIEWYSPRWVFFYGIIIIIRRTYERKIYLR